MGARKNKSKRIKKKQATRSLRRGLPNTPKLRGNRKTKTFPDVGGWSDL